MATQAAKGMTLSVNGNALAANIRDISFPQTVETADDTCLGDATRTFIVTLMTRTLSFSGVYDAAASLVDVTLGALMTTPATVAVSYSPDAGTTTYAGNGIVTSYEITGSVDGAVEYSAEIQCTGTWTRS